MWRAPRSGANPLTDHDGYDNKPPAFMASAATDENFHANDCSGGSGSDDESMGSSLSLSLDEMVSEDDLGDVHDHSVDSAIVLKWISVCHQKKLLWGYMVTAEKNTCVLTPRKKRPRRGDLLKASEERQQTVEGRTPLMLQEVGPEFSNSEMFDLDNSEVYTSDESQSDGASDTDYFLLDIEQPGGSLFSEACESNAISRILPAKGRRSRRKYKRDRRHRSLFSRRKRRRRPVASQGSKMTPKVERILQEANDAFLARDFQQTIQLLEAAIREAPGLHDPFHLLGLTYEELGEKGKALDSFLIAAHLVPKDPELWKNVAAMSLQQKRPRQAIYAYRKALRAALLTNAPLDEGVVFDLASCYLAEGHYPRAAEKLQLLYDRHPGDPFLGRELARCYHHINALDKAIAVLKSCLVTRLPKAEADELKRKGVLLLRAHSSDESNDSSIRSLETESQQVFKIPEEGEASSDKSSTVVVYDPILVNMLADIYFEKKQYADCEALLQPVVGPTTSCETVLPEDLVVKLAVSQLYQNKVESPMIDHAYNLMTSKAVPRGSLVNWYIFFADGFVEIGQYEKALRLYTSVVNLPEVRKNASVWVKIAQYQLKLHGQTTDCPSSTERCISDPDSVARSSIVRKQRSAHSNDTIEGEARLMLSQVLTHISSDKRVCDALRAIGARMGRDKPMGNYTCINSGLPQPFSNNERAEKLEELQVALPDIVVICAKAEKTDLTPKEIQIRAKWIEGFLTLVQDSELDVHRGVLSRFDNRLRNMTVNPESQKILLRDLGVPHIVTDDDNADSGGCSGAVASGSTVIHNRKSKLSSKRKGTCSSTCILPFDEDNGNECDLAHDNPNNPIVPTNAYNASSSRAHASDCTFSNPQDVPKSKETINATGLDTSTHITSLVSTGGTHTIRPNVQVEEPISLHTMMGWPNFTAFVLTEPNGIAPSYLVVETGIGTVMKSAGMLRQAVELIEGILSSKRYIRSSQDEDHRKEFVRKLKRLSLQLAITGGLYRVALSYIRERYGKRPNASTRALQAFGRLLFCGPLTHHAFGSGFKSLTEKAALLENRSWCVRWLLRYPHAFPLVLLTGHFSSLAGRWQFAVAEYARAHHLLPHDDLTCLALATAFLNCALSRTVVDRHGTILRGFAMLATYAERREESLRHILQRHVALECPHNLMEALKCLYHVEVNYNYARAFHHFSLYHLAIPLYINCLHGVASIKLYLKGVTNFTRDGGTVPADAPASSGDTQASLGAPPLMSALIHDMPQLEFSVIHNLMVAFRARGQYNTAKQLSKQIQWND